MIVGDLTLKGLGLIIQMWSYSSLVLRTIFLVLKPKDPRFHLLLHPLSLFDHILLLQILIKKTKEFIFEHSSKQSNNINIDEEMPIALKLIVEKNSRPTMKKCKDKLERFEWREENSLHQMTHCIFC